MTMASIRSCRSLVPFLTKRWNSQSTFKTLNSREELEDLIFNNSSTLPKEIFGLEDDKVKLDPNVLDKILKHSGLEVANESERKDFERALKTQMNFLSLLYEDGKIPQDKSQDTESSFRLISSDHHKKPLSLAELMKQVKGVESERSMDKGETEGSFSIDQLKEKHKNYFIIRQND